MIRALIIVFVNLLLCSPSIAQKGTLTGTVKNAETEIAINGATIYIDGPDQTKELTTDKYGQFQSPMLNFGAYDLTIFAEGFTTLTQTIVIDETEIEFDIQLEKLAINLETIEIQDQQDDSYTIRRLNNVEGIAIYAAKKSEVIELGSVTGNLATNNAREVYKGIAGLNIWENDGSGIQLAIGARGLDPNRTSNFNTRQNGYDISADALGYPESYYTPPTQALKRIEIVRGAASLQYGTQFGGLLNFVFQDGPADKPIEITSENTYGSFGFFNTFNSIGGTKGKVNYYTFYQYKRGDGWRPNSGFHQHTAFAKIGLQLSPQLEVGMEYTFMDYLAQQPGGLQDFEFDADPRVSNRARNWFEVNWNLAALTLDYKISEKTKLNLRNFLLIANRNALGELGPINRPDPLRERDLITGDYQNFGSELRIIHRYSFRKQFSTFLAGIRIYRGFTENKQGDASDDSDPDFQFLNPTDLEKSDYDFPSRNVSFFIENLFNLSERFSITPGIRLEHIRTASDGYFKRRVFSGGQVIFEETFPDSRENERNFALVGIGLGQKLSTTVEMYANFSQNFRAINFSDLSTVNPNLIIDSLLTDEKGFNVDLGIRGSLLDNRIQFDASLFFLKYNNRIGITEIVIPDPIVIERAVAYRTNIGDARIYGLETFWEADLWKLWRGPEAVTALKFFTNFSILQGTYLSGGSAIKGNNVELIPPISLKWGINFQHQNWRVSYLYSYIQEHFSDATNATFVANATRGTIPSYQVMDAAISYSWKTIKLQTGVNNLANAAYFTRRATGYPGPGIIPADGRSFYISLRFRY